MSRRQSLVRVRVRLRLLRLHLPRFRHWINWILWIVDDLIGDCEVALLDLAQLGTDQLLERRHFLRVRELATLRTCRAKPERADDPESGVRGLEANVQ
eukprot:830167-Prorocentrum_minimum.AAC.1